MKKAVPTPVSTEPENPTNMDAVSNLLSLNGGDAAATIVTRELGPALSAAAESQTKPVESRPMKTIDQLNKESRARYEQKENES